MKLVLNQSFRNPSTDYEKTNVSSEDPIFMDESEIKRAIGEKDDYSIWTIGITDDPDRRKSEHENDRKSVKFWRYWKADNETVARNVEKHFLDEGMRGGEGGDTSGNYVYIF